MKRNIIALLISVFSVSAFAQQSIPVYEQYFMSEETLINPAFVGDSDDIEIRTSHRKQWQDLPEGPETTTFTAHANVIDRLGLGVYFVGDQNGNTKTNSFNVAASYHIPIGKSENRQDGQFSFGTSLTFSGYRFGGVTEVQGDPLYEGETNIFVPYINFGGSFEMNGWMAAVSILDLALAYNEPIVNQVEPSPVYYYGMAGKKWNISSNFQLYPVLMYRFNKDDRRQFDANIRAKYFSGKNAFWLGGNYRLDLSKGNSESLTISPAIGAELGRFNFAFSYNIGLTDIAREGNDGWALGLGYNLENFFKPNPRTEIEQ